MRRERLSIAAVCILTAVIGCALCGCRELKRKFIPKKEAETFEPAFYDVTPYTPKPAPARYREHYVLWHNWHMELQRDEGMTQARYLRAINESIRHLEEMSGLLTKEKADALVQQIEKMRTVREELREHRRDIARNPRYRHIINKVERIILNNYSFHKMESFICDTEGRDNSEESEDG